MSQGLLPGFDSHCSGGGAWADEWRRQAREHCKTVRETEEKRCPGSLSRAQLDVKASDADYQGEETTINPRGR